MASSFIAGGIEQTSDWSRLCWPLCRLRKGVANKEQRVSDEFAATYGGILLPVATPRAEFLRLFLLLLPPPTFDRFAPQQRRGRRMCVCRRSVVARSPFDTAVATRLSGRTWGKVCATAQRRRFKTIFLLTLTRPKPVDSKRSQVKSPVCLCVS